MTVMGREYTDKAAAGAELLALCQTVVQRGEAMEIGSYRGFAMRLEYRAMEQAFVVGLRGAAVYFAELGTDVQGNLARLNNALNGMEAHLKKADAGNIGDRKAAGKYPAGAGEAVCTGAGAG